MDPGRCCCYLCQRVFCLFSSRSFVVSGRIFKSLTHFKLIFCMVLENVLIYSFTYSYPVSTAVLIEETVFSLLYILSSFVIE